MITPTLLLACLLLVVGTYLSRLAGLLIGARKWGIPEAAARRDTREGRFDSHLNHAVACLLAAVVVTSVISPTGTEPPLAAGVIVGAVLAWLRCPLPLTVLVAAATTALVRATS